MSNSTPEIRLIAGKPVTSSRNIATFFKRNHKDVLRKIDNLDCSQEFTERNFTLSHYNDDSGKVNKAYHVTKNGFVFLVMGFTGKKAAIFKESYISEFDRMEAELHQKQQTPPVNNGVNEDDKYALLNAMISQMGFKNEPVVVPSSRLNDLDEFIDGCCAAAYVIDKISNKAKNSMVNLKSLSLKRLASA